MAQSSVSTTRQSAFPGMLADARRNKVSESKVNGEASAEIAFGLMVALSTTDTQKVIKLAAITDKLAGIVLHRHDYAKDDELGSTGLKPKVSMEVLVNGACWVQTEEDVTPDDPVYVRAILGAGVAVGAFRITADGVNTIKLGFARWTGPSFTYTPPGGSAIKVAPLSINLDARGATAA